MTVIYILIAILIFGILIVVHEAGHFTVAKLCGVKVDEFAIGMGPVLFQRQKGETMYSLRCLPLGGFCAMAGEDEESDEPRAFTNAPVWKRFLILCAGSFNNFILGLLLVLIVYSSAAAFISPTIDSFFDGCPYEGENALQVGDRFYSIDGHRIYMYSDVADFLSEGTGSYDIVVVRNGQKVELNDFAMVPVQYEGHENKMYGFNFGYEAATFGAKLRYSWNSTMEFGRWVWIGLSQLFHGEAKVSDMSGVVGIVDMMAETGTSAATFVDGLMDVLYLSAFIAVNLAMMNMLPIPALDGGRVFFMLVTWGIEKMIRRKIDPKYEGYIHAAGMILLLAFMAYVMLNDIIKLVVR